MASKLSGLLAQLESMLPPEAMEHLEAIKGMVEEPELPEAKEAEEPMAPEMEPPMPMPGEEEPLV